jgi:hypothetical protein
MTFLAPLFLLGTIAIAVPIYLHLVQRERIKRTPFASLMFVSKIPIKELRKRRLTHLFLLFLRCLGLILLIMAFGRPVMTALWLNQVNPLATTSVVILLDHSLSMSPKPVWERAVKAAQEKIESLDQADEALIVQFGESAEVLAPWDDSSERLRQALRQRAAPSWESTSYVEALRIAVDQLEDARNSRKEIYLITDLQSAGMAAAAGWRVPPEVVVEIETIPAEQTNLFVEEVRVERDVFTDQYPHSILARVRSNSEQPVEGEAQLFLEGQLINRAEFETSPDGTVNLTFAPFELEEGISRGKIVLEPSDALEDDNVYYFVVERQEPRRITVLQEPNASSSFYLESALTSGENLPFQVEVTVQPLSGSIDPSETPLVILNDLSRPPRASLFESYLEAGGGLIVILSNNVRAETYNREWDTLLPVELDERNFVRQQDKPFTSITEVNWEHPIFFIFQDLHKAAVASTQFYSYWRMSPREDASVLARFDGGDAALVEKAVGKGKIIVFASSLDPVWTDFPLRSAYVPFWYRLAQYAASWQSTPAALRINRVLAVEESAGEEPGTSGSWNVIDPKGQRVLGLDQDNPDFIQLKTPGYYEIRSNKGTDWVAVNTPPEESDLATVSLEEFQAVFVPREARVEESSLEASVLERDRQQSLWWLLLIVACLVFMTEWWVANRPRGPSLQENTGS